MYTFMRHAICCRPEVDDDVISGRNVKTIECYVVVDFEVSSSSVVSKIFPRINFVTAAEAADIDDSIKRKRFGVSLLKNGVRDLDLEFKMRSK